MYLEREKASASETRRGCGLPAIKSLSNWQAQFTQLMQQRVISDVGPRFIPSPQFSPLEHDRIPRDAMWLLLPTHSDASRAS